MSRDVHVSHVPADRPWAEWAARTLSGAGLRVSLQVIALPGTERASYRLQFAFSARCLGIAGERAIQSGCDTAPSWHPRNAGPAADGLWLFTKDADETWRALRIETAAEPPLCLTAPDDNRKDLVTVTPCAAAPGEASWAAQVWGIPRSDDLARVLSG